MAIKVILVDDEEKGRKTLKGLFSFIDQDIDIIGETDNINSAFELISSSSPDIVFLDIEMPSGTAFDLLNKFTSIPFEVVFVTAYSEYAIKAFKYSAFDYLLKPIDLDELNNTLTNYANKNKKDSSDQIQLLLNLFQEKNHKRIAIPETDGLSIVDTDDIIRCESDGNYTNIFLTDGSKLTSSKTLGEYEELLPTNIFFRIHRSHLINLNHIMKFVKNDGGYILMKDRSEIEISRRKKSDFIELLSNFNKK